MTIFKALIILIFLLFPFAQLTRLPLAISEINIYLQDLLVFFLVLGWLFDHWLTKKPFVFPRLTFPIVVFSLLAAFSLGLNAVSLEFRQTMVASFYLLRWVIYAGLYFVFFDLLKTEKINLGKWLIFAGSSAAALGVAQYFFYPNLRNLFYLGWDPHYYRVFGTFFDPGFLGIILVLTLILIFNLLLGQKPQKRSRFVFYFLLLILNYLTLALTYSRSAYLAFFAAITVVFFTKRRPKLFLLAVVIFALTIVFLPRLPESAGTDLAREESALARVKNWGQSLTIFKSNPFFGVGFNAYRYAQKKQGFLGSDWQLNHAGAGADSSFLFVLATTGLVGFLAYSWLWWRIFKSKNLVIIASGLALLVSCVFLNSLFYPWVMLWFWALLSNYGE